MNYLESAATLSPCGTYRYDLWRTWDRKKPPCLWVMLNPSTADGRQDDPTIRRCVGFARGWGHGGIVVVNLFAYRVTDPAALSSAPMDPVGPDNDTTILRHATTCSAAVAGWGVHGALRSRGDEVRQLLHKAGVSLLHLGLTKAGQPKHPLYVPESAQLQPLILKETK